MTGDESIPPSPGDAERALATQIGVDGLRTIDATLKSHTQSRWLKAARVVVDALATGRFPSDDSYFDLHARRLMALVESGELEGQGNLLRPRWSEVRLPQKPKFDQDFWEQLWSKTLREHGDKLAHRPPNAHLMAEAANLSPGRALDAGCGHGADALWLAAQGWQVTAVDFSAAALAHGLSMAEAAGADIAERIDWIESDLATWTAEPTRYDLVVCLYVHVAGSVEDMVRRMANGVAPGGTLFLVGHRPIDPSTGAATAAASQVQVSVEGAVAALDSNVWELVVAEERPRAVAGTGVDAVIRARRR